MIVADSPQIPKISSSDREQIEKLRTAVKDEITPYYDTDFNLLRWLKGHNYNFEAILPKLRNHLMLRRSPRWNLDDMTNHPRDHPIHQHWKNGLVGPAIRTPNAIVNVEQTGINDFNGLLMTYSTWDILHARVYDLELMLKQIMEMESKTAIARILQPQLYESFVEISRTAVRHLIKYSSGQDVVKVPSKASEMSVGNQASIIYIMDLEGLTFDKKLLGLLTGPLASISSFMSDNYVEMIRTFVVVNVPSFISTLWNIARPLLPERTRQKVQILGSDWREEIVKIADPRILPSYWNIDGSTLFSGNVEQCTPFDPKGFFRGKMYNDAEVLFVSAGKASFVTIRADKDSTLKWCVTADGHYGFTVFFTDREDIDDAKQMEQVAPNFPKVPGPTVVPVRDELRCYKTGFYKLRFSNEHAWIHTLKIQYIIEVVNNNS
ncbi:hypothetical protein AB6A40_000634 [Gnathostoma spinigerum]|uniref:CRAL-TRIO domain-containing protein n=1 Tax=Gnathostoma spinigerum TaxID=75299 RepID=A0ABD6E2G9_9BILA